MFLRLARRQARYFSTSDTFKVQSISSYFKENSQTILTAATVLTGFFAAGIYSERTAASIKVLEERNKGQVLALEEKSKGQVLALEEKSKGQVLALEERINTAKEEAKKESLERLFNIITQAEYDSAKKTIQGDLKDRMKEITKT